MHRFAWVLTLLLWTQAVTAQDAPEGEREAPAPSEPSAPPAATSDASALENEAASADAGGERAAEEAASEPDPSEPRGDSPISAEEIAGQAAPAPEAPAPQSPVEQPSGAPAAEATGPLVVWATAEWGATFGPARCVQGQLEGTESALRVASALRSSLAVAGLGVATGGALSDHPLLAYAAEARPEELAALLAEAGFSALALGISDLAGPLFRTPRLSEALAEHGIAVIATNLKCGGAAYCDSWYTAEDELAVIERSGRRYALIALLPDDALGRVQPAQGERLSLAPARESMIGRLEEARRARADLSLAVIDHGPDPTAAVNLTSFVTVLPPDTRPDVLISPSAGENLLFLRPLDVQPAIVGTRRDVLTGLRVTRLDEQDSDVLARSVRLNSRSAELESRLRALGTYFCAARAAPLAGGTLARPMNAAEFVELAASAARQLGHADLAVVDPRAFEASFAFKAGATLQRAEVARGVTFDAPLMVARVTLDWLNALRKQLEGVRPLTLIGVEQDRADTLIAGRLAVPGAHYRIVTSAVLVRSQRLPPGADWEPLREPQATLRGALEKLLSERAQTDPRVRVHDPLLGTQWLVRFDGQVVANLTGVKNGKGYSDGALNVDDSTQLGGRLVLNADSDAPNHLFENVVQVAFDRNFTTRTTAQDLTFLQTTYTYRGLWPKPLFYPHPFVEGYAETSFLRAKDADFHHLLLRPRAGLRTIFTRVLSLKLAAGLQYEVFDEQRPPYPGLGGELLLKPWTIAGKSGTLQLEGNVTYYWDSPGQRDEHWMRAQLIAAYQLIGPLQATLSAQAVLRKLPDEERGRGLTMQVGVRVRFVTRAMFD